MTFSHVSQTSSRPPRSEARPSFASLFSYGFRPFFLGAAAYGALAMAVWMAWLASTAAGGLEIRLPVAGSPFAWHAHEMVYGFAAAAIGGFLLTAVPNWTGALPLSGPPLGLLFAVWLVGRVAMAASGALPYPLAAALDVLFFPLLGGFAARQLFTRPAPRNLVFLVLVAALTLCNILFHLGNGAYLDIDPMAAVRTSLLIVVIMIALIGGRIIPAFTHNWLNGQRTGARMPQRIPWLDAAALLSLVLFVALDAAGASAALTGTAALLAALAHGIRLALWRGPATRREPIVWILHLGYGWIVVGLALAALGLLTGRVASAATTHAFGTGAAGTMIMAVMSRASLGHTGRRLIAPRAVVGAYYLITLAAVARVAGPLLAPGYSLAAFLTAGLAWIGAFLVFTFVYAPILTTPRVHTKIDHR